MFHTFISVSYTHLDVYKRQVILMMMMMMMANYHLLQTVKAVLQYEAVACNYYTYMSVCDLTIIMCVNVFQVVQQAGKLVGNLGTLQ